MKLPTDQQMPRTLEARRQEALLVSEKCIGLLKKQFGAGDVIVFGSLRGDSPWHWHSDLDLAVTGLSQDDIWQAYGKIEEIAPSWLKVDLVDLETVPPEVRSSILQEKIVPENKYLDLKCRIEAEIVAIERNLETVRAILAQADSIPHIVLAPALASYINDFYKGCERIGERVAVVLDGNTPRGDSWHQLLLRQVADAGGENRPPLWSGSLLLELDEYRKFRHLVLHTYSVELNVKRVLDLATSLESVFAKIKEAIAVFVHWLDAQAKINGEQNEH